MDYLYTSGSADLAVAFAKLYWPNFVEVEDCVLLEERYGPDEFKAWMLELNGDKRRVELVVNHLHLYDLFYEDGDLKTLEHLARAILRFWKAALNDAFPDRHFEFTYSSEPDDYGPTISFCQAAVGNQGGSV